MGHKILKNTFEPCFRRMKTDQMVLRDEIVCVCFFLHAAAAMEWVRGGTEEVRRVRHSNRVVSQRYKNDFQRVFGAFCCFLLPTSTFVHLDDVKE